MSKQRVTIVSSVESLKHWPAGLALGIAFLFGSLAHGESIQEETAVMKQTSLDQRGKQLRGEVEQAWGEIKEAQGLLRVANDISSTIAKYIPVGISFEDAEVILYSAGFNVLSPPNLNYPSNNSNNLVVGEKSTRFGIHPDAHDDHNLVATMELEKAGGFVVNATITLSPESPSTRQSKVGRTQGIIIYNSL